MNGPLRPLREGHLREDLLARAEALCAAPVDSSDARRTATLCLAAGYTLLDQAFQRLAEEADQGRDLPVLRSMLPPVIQAARRREFPPGPVFEPLFGPSERDFRSEKGRQRCQTW